MRRRLRGDRGSGLPEYALIVGVIAVTSLASIQGVQARSRTSLESRGGEIGMPAEVILPTGSSSGGGSSGGSGTTTTTVASATQVSVASFATTDAEENGHKWLATVTITIRDAGGAAVSGASIVGSWSEGGGDTTCTTNSAGTCPVTRTKLTEGVATVTFTVSSVSGTGLAWTVPEPLPAATVAQPAGCC